MSDNIRIGEVAYEAVFSPKRLVKKVIVKKIIKDGYLSSGELVNAKGVNTVEIRYPGMEEWQSAGSRPAEWIFSNPEEAVEHVSRDLYSKRKELAARRVKIEEELALTDKMIAEFNEGISKEIER